MMAGLGDSTSNPWKADRAGLVIRFRLTPRGGLDAVEGLTETADGPAFKARVRAAAEDGAANEALIALVAAWLDIARRDVELVSGHKARVKLIRVRSDRAETERALQQRMHAFTNTV